MKIKLNKKHLIKYLFQFMIVSIASYLLSPCDSNYKFSIFMGTISATIFAILDYTYPTVVN